MDIFKHRLVSRRTVIKTSAAIAAALCLGVFPGRIVKADSIKEQPNNPDQIGFLYDQQKCIGCKTCQVACEKANKWEAGTEWRRVLTGRKKGNFLSLSCNHCDEPACVIVCPVGAYTKREKDGIVIHNPEKCVGCKYCMYACPYHAPQFSDDTGRISKCHFCFERQDAKSAPMCVLSCPTKALSYGKLSELQKTAGGTNQLPELPSPNITKPSWVILPKA